MGHRSLIVAALVALAVGMASDWAAAADDVASFYKGKQVRMIIGNPPGGGYDLYARLVALHLEKHVPGNPKFVPQNMAGAGSRLAANWLYNVAPKDGTAIGMVGQGTPTDEALNEQGVQFNTALFNWIGNPIVDNNATGIWHTAGVKTIDDLKSKGGVICAGSGATSSSVTYPQTLNNLIGTKIKIISGFPGSPEMNLAIERGEVNCRGGNSWSGWNAETGAWLRDHKMNFVVQWGPKKNPDISKYAGLEVPLASEFAKTEIDRRAIDLISSGVALGRPFLAPPGVPMERTTALRRAFDAVMKDPAFQADAMKQNMVLNPMSGEELQIVASEVARSPAEVIARVKELTDPKDASELKK